MNSYFILLVSWLLIIELSVPGVVYSQENLDPEAEYAKIRTIAFAGDYETAVSEARKLVLAFPSYGDARILLSRILAWQKNYDEAAAIVDTLLRSDPNNADALELRKDILLWSKNSIPVSTDIKAGYYFDSFKEPYKQLWQLYKVGAGHRFMWGQAAAGVNLGKILTGGSSPVNATNVQFEVEAWPRLTKRNYAYLAYAYSPGSYFPGHRAAFEVWQELKHGWALSAGANYYYFDRSDFIAGLSVEKYLGRYWFSAKGYIYFKDEGITASFYLNSRRYFNDKDYLQITLGTGTAPDEPFDIQTDLERLGANSIRLAYNISMGSKLSMRIGAGYSREEFAEHMKRNRFEGIINFSYAIKMK